MASDIDKKQKSLIVFDFDHTLVEENTDVYVLKLAEEGKKFSSENGWMEHMNEIFKYFHKNGVTQGNILDCIAEIKLTEGMEQLLGYTARDNRFDHIIISDSNSVFISHLLEKMNLSSVFLQVFTNPARFLENGLLALEGYHHQDWCSLSSENLCKGDILSTFLESQRKLSKEYSHIFYVGDGFNDLCPGLVLGENDFLLPRENFKLVSVIESVFENDTPVLRSSLKAQVVPWKTGLDILQVVKGTT